MGKRIRDYVKYTQSELENYTKLPGTCVQKINKNIHINFPPYGLGSMKATLLRIISEKKIGSYDYELKGIILDIRNIKVLGNLAALRFDDPTLHIDIQADCYVFNPKIGSIVRGLVKHIAARQISVIIYRVFNVSIRLSSTERYDNTAIELNSEIEFRIKNFDLENLMPYIEGELVAREMPLKCLERKHTYLNIDSDSNSNSGEDEEQSEQKPIIKIPRRRKKSLILPPIEDTDDEEIVFSDIFHLKPEEVENIENGTNKVKKEVNSVVFSESFRLQPDEVEEMRKPNNNVTEEANIRNKKQKNISTFDRKAAAKSTHSSSSSSSSDDSDNDQSNKIKKMILETSKKSKTIENNNIEDNFENSTEPTNKIRSQKITNNKSNEIKSSSSSSSDDEVEYKNITSQTRNFENDKKSDIASKAIKSINVSDNSVESSSGEEVKLKNIKSEKNVDSSSEDEIEFKNIKSETRDLKIEKILPTKTIQSQNIKKNVTDIESSSSDSEIEFKNIISSTMNSKNASSNNKIKTENQHSSREASVLDSDDVIVSSDNPSVIKQSQTQIKNGNSTVVDKNTNKISKIKMINSHVNVKPEIISHIGKGYESEDLFDGISTLESPLQLRIENKLTESEVEKTPKNQQKSNFDNSINQKLSKTITNKINTDSDASITSTTIKSPTKKKRKLTSSEENSNDYSAKLLNNIKTEKSFIHVTPVKNTNGSHDFCTPNMKYKTISESSESKKTESPKNKTISESSSISNTSNKYKSPRKSTISESNSITDSMTDIMSRVLSKKSLTPKKKTASELKSISKSHRKPKTSESVDDSMSDIMARVISQKIKSPSLVETNHKEESTSSDSKAVNDSMASIMDRILSKKIESPKKKTDSELSLVNATKKKAKLSKNTSLTSNSVDNSISDIMSRVLSKKIESPKKKTGTESSTINAPKNKARLSRKTTLSESNTVGELISDIMARVLSKKMESNSAIEQNNNKELYVKSTPTVVNSEENTISSKSSSAANSKIKSSKSKKSTPSDSNSLITNTEKKNLTGLDSSLAQILAKVQNEKIQSTTETNNSKNMKKRKINDSDQNEKVPDKKSKKRVNEITNKIIEPTQDNNDVSFNCDSFSVPSLSSTRIENVTKAAKFNVNLKSLFKN